MGRLDYLRSHISSIKVRPSRPLADELVVVDGNNVLHRIWPSSWLRGAFGGDYNALIRRLQRFVLFLSSTAVKPIFVFDGFSGMRGKEQDDKDFVENVLPTMYLSLVSAALSPMNVPFHVCSTSADCVVAAMARRLGATVVGGDSDVLGYGLKQSTAYLITSDFLNGSNMKECVETLDGRRLSSEIGVSLALMAVRRAVSATEVMKRLKSPEATCTLDREIKVNSRGDEEKKKLGLRFTKVVEVLDRFTNPVKACRKIAEIFDPVTANMILSLVANDLRILFIKNNTKTRNKIQRIYGQPEVSELSLELYRKANSFTPHSSTYEAFVTTCPRWLIDRFRDSRGDIRQLVAIFGKNLWVTGGVYHPKEEQQPYHAGFDVMTAFSRLVFDVCPRNPRHDDWGRVLHARNGVGDDFKAELTLEDTPSDLNFTEETSVVQARKLFYRLTGLRGLKKELKIIPPGWRRTAVVLFALWTRNGRFTVDRTAFNAALLTHMCLSGLISAPEEKKVPRMALFRLQSVTWRNLDSLKSVAVWLDAMLVALGCPLPRTRPEMMFHGQIYASFYLVLCHLPVTEVLRLATRAEKKKRPVADTYFKFVSSLCPCPSETGNPVVSQLRDYMERDQSDDPLKQRLRDHLNACVDAALKLTNGDLPCGLWFFNPSDSEPLFRKEVPLTRRGWERFCAALDLDDDKYARLVEKWPPALDRFLQTASFSVMMNPDESKVSSLLRILFQTTTEMAARLGRITGKWPEEMGRLWGEIKRILAKVVYVEMCVGCSVVDSYPALMDEEVNGQKNPPGKRKSSNGDGSPSAKKMKKCL